MESACSAILHFLAMFPYCPIFIFLFQQSTNILWAMTLSSLVFAFLSEVGFLLFSNLGNFGIFLTLQIFYSAAKVIIQIWILGMLLVYGSLVSDVSNYNYNSPDHGLCWLDRNWYLHSRNYYWSPLKFLNNFAKQRPRFIFFTWGPNSLGGGENIWLFKAILLADYSFCTELFMGTYCLSRIIDSLPKPFFSLSHTK